jgi:hypothetical protein
MPRPGRARAVSPCRAAFSPQGQIDPPGPVGASPPTPLVIGRLWGPADAPPAPVSFGSAHVVQLWLKQDPPFWQIPQSTLTPQSVPAPHSQSIPHFGTWQQVPVLSQVSVPHEQSVGHLRQFSP